MPSKIKRLTSLQKTDPGPAPLLTADVDRCVAHAQTNMMVLIGIGQYLFPNIRPC